MSAKRIIFAEPVINWIWYTELDLNPDNTVTIIRHYRLHGKRDRHPNGTVFNGGGGSPYRENEERIALEYHVPGKGYLKISNPQHIFSYPTE